LFLSRRRRKITAGRTVAAPKLKNITVTQEPRVEDLFPQQQTKLLVMLRLHSGYFGMFFSRHTSSLQCYRECSRPVVEADTRSSDNQSKGARQSQTIPMMVMMMMIISMLMVIYRVLPLLLLLP
jgi:hypothetical protein